jgi:hypothetical protein
MLLGVFSMVGKIFYEAIARAGGRLKGSNLSFEKLHQKLSWIYSRPYKTKSAAIVKDTIVLVNALSVKLQYKQVGQISHIYVTINLQ